MELNLKYQQYNNQQFTETQDSQHTKIKPNQELIDFFEKNSSFFMFKEFLNELNLDGQEKYAEFYLSDGTFVKLGITSGIINIGVLYPNKTKFIGCWTNVVDDQEFRSSLDKVPKQF